MSDDWQVVEEALEELRPYDIKGRHGESLAALARLREREAAAFDREAGTSDALDAAIFQRNEQRARAEAAEARVAEYDALWAKDNTCGICPYRMKIQARVAELEVKLRCLLAERRGWLGSGDGCDTFRSHCKCLLFQGVR